MRVYIASKQKLPQSDLEVRKCTTKQLDNVFISHLKSKLLRSNYFSA